MTRLVATLVLVAAVVVAVPAHAALPAAGCDFNRDNRADLVVGIPKADVGSITQGGAVEILRGSSGGIGTSPIESLDEDVPGVNGVAEAWDRYGTTVVCGDFNGDGDADVAIASPDENRFSLADAGQVAVMYGDGSGVRTDTDRIVMQNTTNVKGQVNKYDNFGTTMAVGDFDGNGIDDLVVGVPLEDISGTRNAGVVQVFYGFSGGLGFGVKNQYWSENLSKMIGAPQRSDFFGAALAVGDFDGDGRDDLAIGIPGQSVNGSSDAGQVSVLYGSGSGLRVTTNEVWNLDSSGIPGGTAVGDEFGASLAVGDFDNDGFADLAVGAPGKDVAGREQAGQVFVIPGSSGGLTSNSAAQWHQDAGLDDAADAYDHFGAALAAGDFDSDGFDELAIGIPNEWDGASPQEGAVHVILGSGSGLKTAGDEFWQLAAMGLPASSGDKFGTTLTVGDFNGNGRLDLAVGVPGATVSGDPSAGAVVVMDGSTTSGLAGSGQQYITRGDIAGSSSDAYERFGSSLAAS